ncbi:hypothetical protein [Aeoliella mucimassa]|uniref:hypothetical protein n=1 Tax=Aeoliella mucimassa TaxID=2527972 RepID=UPI0011A1F4FC|nr:hypothetical protein [Aeoliella mucimassa]
MANIVGILILLVLVVGVRAASQPQHASETVAETQQEPVELLEEEQVEEIEKEVAASAREVADLAQSLAKVDQQLETSEDERLLVTTYAIALEQEYEKHKQQLDEQSAERLEIREELAALDSKAHQLMLKKVGLTTASMQPATLVNTPTPIVRRNIEETVHLRLGEGRIAVAPLDKLVKMLESVSPQTRLRDLNRGNGVARIGPADGFELLYAVQQAFSDVSPMGTRTTQHEVFAELRPLFTPIGVEAEQALQPGDLIDQALRPYSAHNTAVVLWVLPDGIKDYRKIVSAVRERGYAVDVRLLLEGTHIAIGTSGRKTAAQ